MMGKLDSKVAIVTGGASGFGEATCILFAEEGSAVVVADVDTKKGLAVVERIKEKGGSAEFVEVDVSKPDHATRLVAETVKSFDKINILFNNAGILGPRDTYTVDFPEESAERLISVNFNGVFYCTKQVIPEMIKSGGGSIISTGSDSAFLGNRSLAVYSATKGAVLAFSRVVAMEYVDRGIRVNTISPGAGKTPMHAELFEEKKDVWKAVVDAIPMKRACYPEDIARAALFFASDDSKYITGTNLMVDGGWTTRGL